MQFIHNNIHFWVFHWIFLQMDAKYEYFSENGFRIIIKYYCDFKENIFFILHLMAMQSDLQWKIIANSLEKVVTYLILFSA